MCFFHSLQLQKTWKCFQWKWLNMQPVINIKNFWKISLRKGIPTLHPLKSGLGTDYCNIDERPRDSLTTRVGRVFRQLCNRPPKLDIYSQSIKFETKKAAGTLSTVFVSWYVQKNNLVESCLKWFPKSFLKRIVQNTSWNSVFNNYLSV